MQGLADGYFILPYTIADYLADEISTGPISVNNPEFQKSEAAIRNRLDYFLKRNRLDYFLNRLDYFLNRLDYFLKGSYPVDYFHKA